ncbi:MAG: thioredoxin [Alphaproteobacteria bacterium]|nr:thioredoxin [Alphaproteobacteria bacterium]
MVEPLIGHAPAAPDAVKDSNTRNFRADVLDPSRETPVIVDFWAPWCGPCKQLGPILEKVVKASNGKVKLVKINVDENQPLAQQLHIQSIPAVYAFQGGQPVDGFVGALPESQVKAFVERLMGGAIGPSPIDEALEAAQAALTAGDFGAAANIYGQILRHEPGNPAAIAGLTRCYLAKNDLAAAKQTLALTPKEQESHPDVSAARTALQLAEEVGKTGGDLAKLKTEVAANPSDLQARFDLGNACVAAGDHGAAIDQFLDIVKRDPKWNEGAARAQLVKVFEVLGFKHDLSVSGRRRLSAILFS